MHTQRIQCPHWKSTGYRMSLCKKHNGIKPNFFWYYFAFCLLGWVSKYVSPDKQVLYLSRREECCGLRLPVGSCLELRLTPSCQESSGRPLTIDCRLHPTGHSLLPGLVTLKGLVFYSRAERVSLDWLSAFNNQIQKCFFINYFVRVREEKKGGKGGRAILLL